MPRLEHQVELVKTVIAVKIALTSVGGLVLEVLVTLEQLHDVEQVEVPVLVGITGLEGRLGDLI